MQVVLCIPSGVFRQSVHATGQPHGFLFGSAVNQSAPFPAALSSQGTLYTTVFLVVANHATSNNSPPFPKGNTNRATSLSYVFKNKMCIFCVVVPSFHRILLKYALHLHQHTPWFMYEGVALHTVEVEKYLGVRPALFWFFLKTMVNNILEQHFNNSGLRSANFKTENCHSL